MSAVQKTAVGAALMSKYNRPVSVVYIDKAQDWATRQKIQYEAMLGLMKSDFHGLKDFQEQMEIFSSASLMLKGPWMAIKSIVPINRSILMRLVPDPLLGTMVGRYLMTVLGFSKINMQPEEILKGGSLGGRLGIS